MIYDPRLNQTLSIVNFMLKLSSLNGETIILLPHQDFLFDKWEFETGRFYRYTLLNVLTNF